MKKIDTHNVIGVLLLLAIGFVGFKLYTLERSQASVEAQNTVCITIEKNTNCNANGKMLKDKDLQPTVNPQPTVTWQEI